MEKKRSFMVTIVLLLLFVPVLAQAHLLQWEGEVFRKFGKPVEDWGPKVEGMNGLYGAPVELGGEDWSFEYPFILPPGEADLARTFKVHLHKNDVDVIKYTAAEDEEFCVVLFCLPPACKQYRNYYPVIGILGPGVENQDEFPFEVPADCKDCGFMRTHPTKAKRWTERPVVCGPPGAFPDSGLWYTLDWATDAIFELKLKGPGNFYIVIYEPEGKPGDATGQYGWDECESHYKPEDWDAMRWWAYIGDENKWTHVRCNQMECWDWGDLPASYPSPSPCGPPLTPECQAEVPTMSEGENPRTHQRYP